VKDWRNLLQRCVWAASLGVLLLCANGCTVAGMSVSYSMKDQHKVATRIDGAELRELPDGARVRVDLFDGSSQSGQMRGFHVESNSLYAARYESFCDSTGSWFPRLGESVVVRARSDIRGSFQAFDFDGIRVAGQETGIGLRNVFSLDATNGSVDGVSGTFLTELSRAGRIPYQSSLQLESHGDRVTIPTDAISDAYRVQSAWWVFVPVAVGLVVDAAILFSVDWT